jgi:hypothetical protein
LAEGHIHTDGAGEFEYGLRPNRPSPIGSWGVAPGYGEQWPSAKNAVAQSSISELPRRLVAGRQHFADARSMLLISR